MFLASLAMVATLPGRSVGLGLITEPLIRDLGIDRVRYGVLTFWATLLGAGFCLIAGRAIDRVGVRWTSSVVTAALAVTVLALGRVEQAGLALGILLLLSRGLGQSALSLASLATVGKWFGRRLPMAMGVFSVVLGLGFVAAIPMTSAAIEDYGWRATWRVMGCVLFGLALLFCALVRRGPESCGLPTRDEFPATRDPSQASWSLGTAIRTPTLWVFVLCGALYNLVIAGVLLWNESILAQRGLGTDAHRSAMAAFMGCGIVANLVAGALAHRLPLGRLLGGSMGVLTLALLAHAEVRSTGSAVAQAAALGASGGVITVLFFSSFGTTFGRAHLGKIQGLAQVFTVLASSSGPWFFAECFERSGRYEPAFWILAPASLLLAVLAWHLRPLTSPDEPLRR